MTPEKFWSYVWKSPEPDGCWLWMGSRTTYGYGRFKENRISYRAHRFALELSLGRKLQKSEQANHACNVRHCVRVGPGHIYNGTNKENMLDAIKAGTMYFQRPDYVNPMTGRYGVKSPVAKLNEDKIRLIRKLRAEGWSQQSIANKVGTHQTNVGFILRGVIWSHVT